MTTGISVSAIYDAVGYQPHRVQRTIHAAARDHRFRVVCAGRRTGKSTQAHQAVVVTQQAQAFTGAIDEDSYFEADFILIDLEPEVTINLSRGE